MAKKQVIITDANLGGIADSPYMGVKNSLASIVGFDLHSIPGVMLVNQKLTVEPNAPTDDYYKIVPCSDGNIYYFGKTLGNVWKKSGGSYTQLGTVAPSSGAVGVLDAIEFNGFIYYFMQNKVGQWNFANAFSTRNDSWNSFTNGNATYHPVLFLANTQFIFIGDGNLIAQIDNNNTWTPNALNTIAKNLTVTCVGGQGSDLLIGGSILNVGQSFVLRWNTWSPVPTTAYPVKEQQINCFFPTEDDVIINAGLSGNLYRLNGANFVITKQVPPIFPNTYSPTLQGIINYPAVANKQGIPLFGFSSLVGDPALEGIYSFGRRNEGYPRILVLEVPISTGSISGVNIWSMASAGNDIYVSSHDSNGYRIDKLDWTAKYASAYFESLILRYSRTWLENFEKFIINIAQALPAGTSIAMSYRINGGNYIAFTSGTNPSNDNFYYDSGRQQQTADSRQDARTMQIKVTVTASGNTAPIIEDVLLYLLT